MAAWKNINCAICGIANTEIIYNQKTNYLELSELAFFARKFPKQIHSQIVQCKSCGLVFANPILDSKIISKLYSDANWFAEPQLENMKYDYLREIMAILPLLKSRDAMLEIGCADGFLLAEAGKLFKKAVGVEPSKAAAIAKLAGLNIIHDEFKPGLFEPKSFDFVCAFQVLDHLITPMESLLEIYKILKPGGIFLAVNHDIKSPLARLFGKNCAMYDIQHIYLFDTKTIRLFLENGGLEVLKAQDIKYTYRLDYAIKMLPFGENTRNNLIRLTKMLHLDSINFSMFGGNMVAVGKKPL